MLKYIAISIILVMLVAVTVQAHEDLGGRIGMEYNTLRSEMNWIVGLNYAIEDKLTIGFDIFNWTTIPRRSDTPPFFGFSPMSSHYLWYANLNITENIKIKVERFYEHWMKQSDEHNNHTGIKYGIEYSF